MGNHAPIPMPSSQKEIQQQFFEFLFGDQEGYLCISTQFPFDKKSHRDQFFRWPAQKADITSFIQQAQLSKNVYFCVHLLDKASRKKENALPTNLAWADLDAQNPKTVNPPPSIALETSPGRYHGLWRMALPVSPEVAEDYSRRLAYLLDEADPSGWDRTQLLRIPFTINHKYDQKPIVSVLYATEEFVAVEELEKLPYVAPANGNGPDHEPPVPDLIDADAIIQRYAIPLSRTGFTELFEYEPSTGDDWSRLLWKLINTCLECGMSADETFSITFRSKVNKYERDGRPPRYLWRDIIKAQSTQLSIKQIHDQAIALTLPELYTEKELASLPKYWIDEYCEWAAKATDALPQYHGLAGMMAVSSVCSAGVRLETSYGTVVPNLWAMILGESTVTRKTTAMDLITKMVMEIDSEIILATDGSAEGLLTSLSTRPGRTSVFYRDEVSGFFNSVLHKDYLAGIIETFTHLYDSPKIMSRVLRKETIRISNPIFLFLGGGIKERVYSLLSEEYIISGFLPRFLVVSGEQNIDNLRMTGPPVPVDTVEHDRLAEQLAQMYKLYSSQAEIQIAGQTVSTPTIIKAEMSEAAWKRYGDIEMKMVTAAYNSAIQMVALPTFERLSRSLMKLAMLLAASRQVPKKNKIKVELHDIIKAAVFIQDWGRYSVDLVMNCGIEKSEKALRKIRVAIDKNPGILRSDLMRNYHLSKREADDILMSLEDRGEIRIVKQGKAARLWVI